MKAYPYVTVANPYTNTYSVHASANCVIQCHNKATANWYLRNKAALKAEVKAQCKQ